MILGGVSLACGNDTLGIFKCLLTWGFRYTCQSGHLEVVRYLLTSPELEGHADIHANNNEGFRWACKYGHLDVVKYLLTSPELKEHADVHAKNDEGFCLACERGCSDVVKFLVFDVGIKKTKEISDFLKDNNYHEINRWFEIRDLNDKIDKELSPSKNNKKNKI